MKFPCLLIFFLFGVFFRLSAQLNTYPYQQSFEDNFKTGTNVEFLPHCWGNDVRNSSRIYQAGPAYAHSGQAALGVQPTGTFTAELQVHFDASAMEAGEISFQARTERNGSGNRPAIVRVDFSTDGGVNFTPVQQLGDETTFPNAPTSYREFTLDIPEALFGRSLAVVRIRISRGAGEGSVARLFIDDFMISDQPAALRLVSAAPQKEDQLLLRFNRAVDQASAARASNYSIDHGAVVREAVPDPDNARQVMLEVSPLQSEISYTLLLGAVLDMEGNSAVGQTAVIRYKDQYEAQTYDLLISEVHAAPNEQTLLPNTEWVELYNASGRILQLEGYRFADNSRSTALPTYSLPPEGYVVLAPANGAEQLGGFGPVLGLSPWPSLNNSEDVINIYSPEERLLDRVPYSQSWYGNSQKAQGGWSLERIDLGNPCGGAANWAASVAAAGGTPAAVNSIAARKPDLKGPELLQAYTIDSLNIQAIFNEPLDTSRLSVSQVSLEPFLPVRNLQAATDQPERLLILLSKPISAAYSYQLRLNNISDCAGNLIRQEHAQAAVAIPEKALSGDVLLNEVMYDPLATSEEWVELVNATDKYLNLQNWQLATYDSGIKSTALLSRDYLILPPKEFLVVSRRPADVLLAFPSAPVDRMLQLNGMPQLPNAGDSLALISNDGMIMDLFGYHNRLHSPFIRNSKGVSLERVSLQASTNEASNWMSAASSVNYGTPGRPNSQRYQADNLGNKAFVVEPEVILPAGDGRADFVSIRYKAARPGLQLSLRIYDSQGRLVRTLARNQLLGHEGFFTWDGTNDNSSRVRTGYYIIDLQVHGNDGDIKRHQKTIVVGNDFY